MLRIGDIISLRHGEPGGSCVWLSAEGHLSDEAFTNGAEHEFDDCLWTVYIQNQYSAVKEYEDALLNYEEQFGADEDNASSSSAEAAAAEPEALVGVASISEEKSAEDTAKRKALEMLHQLQKAAITEARLNERLMVVKLGKPVSFGDVIQLRHIKSNKFLSVSSIQLAKQERENMRVVMLPNGDPLSSLAMMPKYKTDTEGSPIYNNVECYLRVHERTGDFIRAAKKNVKFNANAALQSSSVNPAKEEKRGEVNSSAEHTSWSISIFQSSLEIKEKIIHAGRLVSFNDLDTSSYLTLETQTPGLTEKSRIVISPLNYLASSSLILSSLMHNVGTNVLWYMENEEFYSGGAIAFRANSVTLRDLNTGLYLRQEEDGRLFAVKNRELCSYFELSSPFASADCLYFSDAISVSLSSTTDSGKVLWLSASKELTLSKSDSEEEESSHNPKLVSTVCLSSQDKSQALNFIPSSVVHRLVEQDLYFGVQATARFRKFEILSQKLFQHQRIDSRSMDQELFAQASYGVKSLLNVLDLLIKFLSNNGASEKDGFEALGFDMFADAILEPISDERIVVRQTMMREQGLLDVAMDILELCSHNIYDNVKTVVNSNEGMASRMPGGGLVRGQSTKLFTPTGKNSQQENSGRKKSRGNSIDSTSEADTVKSSPSLLGAVSKAMSFRRTSDGNGKIDKAAASAAAAVAKSKLTSPVSDVLINGNAEDSSSGSSSESDDDNEAAGTKQKLAGKALNYQEADPRRSSGGGATEMTRFGSSEKIPSRRDSAASMKKAISSFEVGDSRRTSAGTLAARAQKDQYQNAIMEASNLAKRIPMSQEIAKNILFVLLRCLKGNHTNQIHLADRFPTILKHITTQDVAVQCLKEMLRENLHILQTKVRQREIDIFVKLLRETEMSVTFLKLLQSTCSCPMGVDSTQRMVTLALFGGEESTSTKQAAGPRGSLVIKVSPDMTRLTKVSWVNGGLSYFPPPNSPEYEIARSSILGIALIANGLPGINLRWDQQTERGTASVTRLFGLGFIPMELLCAAWTKFSTEHHLHTDSGDSRLGNHMQKRASTNQISKSHKSDGRGGSNFQKAKLNVSIKKEKAGAGKQHARTIIVGMSTAELKFQVAEYLIAELYLVADLCLDRNYVSIHILESIFTYDVLITILKSEKIPSDFKAPICRILRCLWIDREPQVEAKYPRLIRISKKDADDGGDNNDAVHYADFESNHKGSPYAFCLLQQTISQYLRLQFDPTKCDELSSELLDTLHTLIKFGFYASHRQLKDIVVPIISAIDGHKRHQAILAASKLKKHRQQVESEGVTDVDTSLVQRTWNSFKCSWHTLAYTKSRAFVQSTCQWLSSICTKVRNGGYSGLQTVSPETSELSTSTSRNNRFQRATLGTLAVNAMKKNEQVQKRKTKQLSKQALAALRKQKIKSMWESKWLDFTETILGMSGVLSCVLIVVLVSCVQLFADDPGPQSFYDIFDDFVTAFFAAELFLRCFCYARINLSITPMFHNQFNLLDLSLVLLDFVLLGLGQSGGSANAARVTRVARVIRLLRLLRILRAIRLLKKISEENSKKKKWVMPKRYTNTPEPEFRTTTSMLRILAIVFDRIQDQNLDIITKTFHKWVDEQKLDNPRSEIEVYNEFSAAEVELSIPDDFERILIDILMHSNHTLVQEALELLMNHKNQKQILFHVASQVQIVYSPKVESKLNEVKHLIFELQNMAEKYEIWQPLESEDEMNTAQDMLEMIRTVTKSMQKQNDDRSLSMKTDLIPDAELQSLLRNMDFMNCCIKILEALFDGGREKLRPIIVKILSATCRALCAFCYDNAQNQALAFKHIEWFVERVDDGFESSKVLRAILRGNPLLIKQCPKTFIADFAQKILLQGRRPQYLDLYLGMTEMSMDDDRSVKSVENDIARLMTSREWKQHILLWCCPFQSEAYCERSKAMEVYTLSGEVPSDEALSPELIYHVNLLHVLALCNLGPKLEAVYGIDDIICTLMDPATTLPQVKKGLGLFLIQMIDSGIDNIDASENMWAFFDHFAEYLERLQQEITSLFRRAQSAATTLAKIHTGEWLDTCLTIVIMFFSGLDLLSFGENLDADSNIKITRRTDAEAQILIKRLYTAIRIFMDANSTQIGPELRDKCSISLVALCRHSATISYEHEENGFDKKRGSAQRQSVTYADIQQLYLRQQYGNFIFKLKSSIPDESREAVKLFSQIPFLEDNVESDVRLEPLIRKLTSHLRSNLEQTGFTRVLTKNQNEAIWLMRTFRIMLQNILEMPDVDTNLEYDATLLKEDSKVARLRNVFNDYGLTFLCLDCIATGIKEELCIEAINLLIVLLAKLGGNVNVQEKIYGYLSGTDSFLFFAHVKEIFENLMAWALKDTATIYEEGEADIVIPPEINIFLLLQLVCEGDSPYIRDLLRDQPSNSQSFNIAQSLAAFADLLSRHESPLFTNVSISVFKTILKVMHGPNRGNQEQFVLQTELLVSMNRLMRFSRPKGLVYSISWAEDMEILKEQIIDVLRCSLEGLSPRSVVFERVSTLIELNVLNMLLLPASGDDANILSQTLAQDDMTACETKYLLLLEVLSATNDSVTEVAAQKIAENISSIEVIWHDDVITVYFRKPEILEDLSGDFFSKLTLDLDVSSQEVKLMDLMKRTKSLYKEAKLQQVMKKYGLSNLWSWRGRLSWFMFGNALLMNSLLLCYYERIQKPGSDEYLDMVDVGDPDVSTAIFGLNVVQIVVASLTVLIYLLIRMPTNFMSNVENGESLYQSVVNTLIDPLPIWYMTYLLFAVLAITVERAFLTTLLLDWISLNSTTQDLLLAVQYPVRQLLATFVMIFIVLNVFASIVLIMYRDDIHEEFHIVNMWDAFKLNLSYGLRGEWGVGEVLHNTLGERIVLDVVFYFVVLAILRNIFFAIIVDTFGKLREVKYERDMQANNSCFICGVERHDFDKIASMNMQTTFQHHRTVVHNTRNYIDFVLHLWDQPLDSDTGIEMYVRKCIDKQDITWFPIGVAWSENEQEGRGHHESGERRHSISEGARQGARKKIEGGGGGSGGNGGGNSGGGGEGDGKGGGRGKDGRGNNNSSTNSSGGAASNELLESKLAEISLALAKITELPTSDPFSSSSSSSSSSSLSGSGSPTQTRSQTLRTGKEGSMRHSTSLQQFQSNRMISSDVNLGSPGSNDATISTLNRTIQQLASRIDNLDKHNAVTSASAAGDGNSITATEVISGIPSINSNKEDDEDETWEDGTVAVRALKPITPSANRALVERPWATTASSKSAASPSETNDYSSTSSSSSKARPATSYPYQRPLQTYMHKINCSSKAGEIASSTADSPQGPSAKLIGAFLSSRPHPLFNEGGVDDNETKDAK